MTVIFFVYYLWSRQDSPLPPLPLSKRWCRGMIHINYSFKSHKMGCSNRIRINNNSGIGDCPPAMDMGCRTLRKTKLKPLEPRSTDRLYGTFVIRGDWGEEERKFGCGGCREGKIPGSSICGRLGWDGKGGRGQPNWDYQCKDYINIPRGFSLFISFDLIRYICKPYWIDNII